MNVEQYRGRMAVYGAAHRDDTLSREQRMLQNKLKNTLSYQKVEMWSCAEGYDIDEVGREENRVFRTVAIINSDNLNEKHIISLPGEDLEHGALVRWMDNYWLITERDANTTVYTKCKMLQCNHLLKWVSADGVVHKQWCVIEDSTKYLTGELEDRHFIVTRGDQRVYMSIARNDYTIRFERTDRFLIDDDDAPLKIAYSLSKPLKLGWTVGGKGVFKFVLLEAQSTEFDDQINGVADYYRYHAKSGEDGPNDNTPKNDRNGWL